MGTAATTTMQVLAECGRIVTIWIKHLVKKVLHVLAPSCSSLLSCCPWGQLFVEILPQGLWGFFIFYFLLPSEMLAFCKNSQLAVIQANHLITLVFCMLSMHTYTPTQFLCQNLCSLSSCSSSTQQITTAVLRWLERLQNPLTNISKTETISIKKSTPASKKINLQH